MAFKLDPSVSVTKGVRKVARDRLDDALELLAGINAHDPAAVEEAVHDARKRSKQARSLARLGAVVNRRGSVQLVQLDGSRGGPATKSNPRLARRARNVRPVARRP